MTASDAGARGPESVCSLPSDSLADRMAMIRREILPHVTRREALADGVALEFEHTPAMEETLQNLVAFERRCCGGLTWELERAAGPVLRLGVRGLAPDSDVFEALEADTGSSTYGDAGS